MDVDQYGLDLAGLSSLKRKAPRRMNKPNHELKEDRQWLAYVHDLPCVLCQRLGMAQTEVTQAHHPREAAGAGQRSPDHLAVALCAQCHMGPTGVHGDKTLLRLAKVEIWALVADTIRGVQQLMKGR